MEHYVTLFDSLFLPQGLALHSSMQRHAGSYTLWVLCVDTATHAVLQRLALPNVHLLELTKVETAELANIKPSRSRGEYCWTLTPFSPRFVFEADPAVQRVTYLDADLWFVAHPRPLFSELESSGKSVMITEHAYAPQYDQARTSGRFCVQFMTFVREGGETVRAWWADRCIEWCHARFENGKFGDQMYLDDWPDRFPDDVHVLHRASLLQAPWNTTRFPPGEAVAYHFHGLRLLREGAVLMTDRYRINTETSKAMYLPYLGDLREAASRLKSVGHEVVAQIDQPVWRVRLRTVLLQARLRWSERAPRRFARL